MRILLLGHGRMGQLVESLAPSYGATIAGVIDERSGDRAIADGELRRRSTWRSISRWPTRW